VAYLGSGFNVLGSLANGPSTHNLAPPIPATGIAFLAFLLAAQPFGEIRIVKINQ
jgi:hypothetical protein